MKFILAILTCLLFLFTASAQGQDTTVRKPQSNKRESTPSRQYPADKKTSSVAPAPSSNSNDQPDSNPAINKIAVSDPGMPAEKPETSKSNNSTNPKERKKKSKAEVSPK